LRKISNHIFTQYLRGVRAHCDLSFVSKRLQAAFCFVTTVKQGAALEALAWRESRVRLFKPKRSTSDGSEAAITAGGELHTATKFDITKELTSCRDMIASAVCLVRVARLGLV
jgi:hypothetical protein